MTLDMRTESTSPETGVLPPLGTETRCDTALAEGRDVPLTLGVRYWEHVIPLALGEIGQGLVDVRLLETTPDLWSQSDLDGAETSFSRYVRARAEGDDRVTALPLFLMRGFRHRCILVRRDSTALNAADLKGARVGLTGWADSGNTWTRAVLREAGIGVADASWQVGPLTADHPVLDRIGGVPVSDNVQYTPGNRPLIDLLAAGRLDAVMTPFMPPRFYEPDSPIRPLYPDTRTAEVDYFQRHGFVPGIHVLALHSDVLRHDPEIAQRILDLFETAKRISRMRRDKLMDITPWHNEDIAFATRVVGDDWLPFGFSGDRQMVCAFQEELVAQRLLKSPVPERDLFPFALEPSSTTPMRDAEAST
jgi:4,5-dihydroxyphthalate decarboxylase